MFNFNNEHGCNLIFSESESKNLNQNLKAPKSKTTGNVRVQPYTLAKPSKYASKNEASNETSNNSTLSPNSSITEFTNRISSALNSCLNSLINCTKSYFQSEKSTEGGVKNESKNCEIKERKLHKWACFVCLNKNIKHSNSNYSYCSICNTNK